MKPHNRQFFDCVVHFDCVFSNLYRYHNSLAITVEQTGTANKTHWSVTAHKVSEIATLTHQLQQNLQLNSLPKKSFGAWICNHSNTPHLTESPKRNAAAKATTATQHTNSITVTIQKSKPTSRKQYIAIPDGRTGYPNPGPPFVFAYILFCTKNCG